MTSPVDLVARLRQRGWQLATAESLTGGALCSTIVSVPGASQVLVGGVVAYATEIKQHLLRVDPGLLREHGPVHADVARQMAENVGAVLAPDAAVTPVGLSTTGIAGPDSPDGQPVGTVYIGVSTANDTIVRRFLFEGDRASIRQQSVDAAIALAQEHC
ncbi:CinA family protein [Microbacterium sp. YY-01]|uniref:CinA family protein n=1 Tax=Microbacterium sp. YY-01 TaxID=3421634 RepID=UPI003D16447A